MQFQSHPWHGIRAESDRPGCFNAFIELTPADGVKYEVDKASGHIRVDRPQPYSSQCPTLYGFIPQTLCGDRFAGHTEARLNRRPIAGDGDPLDICVLSERPVAKHGVLVSALPLGGLRILDSGQADDKIIAVMHGDLTYGHMTSVDDLSTETVDRLRHYFLTYKQPPDADHEPIQVVGVYGREEALAVIRWCRDDYAARFGQYSNTVRG